MKSNQTNTCKNTLSNSTDRQRGTKREELGELSKTREVSIVVDDNGAHPTMGTRTARIDETGQEWVKHSGMYWKYPQQVEY